MDSKRDPSTHEESGFSKAESVNEEDPEPRYPGVEDLFRCATFLRETHPGREGLVLGSVRG